MSREFELREGQIVGGTFGPAKVVVINNEKMLDYGDKGAWVADTSNVQLALSPFESELEQVIENKRSDPNNAGAQWQKEVNAYLAELIEEYEND
jgi:hypothetical protein